MPKSTKSASHIQRRATSPADRWRLLPIGSSVLPAGSSASSEGSSVEALNVWNNLTLGLKALSETKDGQVRLVFADKKAAESAWKRVFPEPPELDTHFWTKRASFDVPPELLINLLPQKTLQKEGVDFTSNGAGTLKGAFADLKQASRPSDESFGQAFYKLLVGRSPDEKGTEVSHWETILHNEFNEKFKRYCLDELSPVNRFNVDFFPACFEGEVIPQPVALDVVQHARRMSDSTSDIHAYPGQMMLKFASQKDCEDFIELLRKKENPKAEWIKPEASGRIMTLDLRRLYNLYPDKTEGNDFVHYVQSVSTDKAKSGTQNKLAFYLNNLLAEESISYRILDVRFSPAGNKSAEFKMRVYFSEENHAKDFLEKIYQTDEDKPEIVKVREGLCHVDIPPPRIYRLIVDNSEARKIDKTTMVHHAALPLRTFRRSLATLKREEEKSWPDFKKPDFEELVKQAASAVNTTGEKSLPARFFRMLTKRKDTWLTVDKISVDVKTDTVKFSLKAIDEASLKKFSEMCLDAGCPYAKNEVNLANFQQEFIFSIADMERLIEYWEGHPELIGEKPPLDFSTLRLHEELTYFETVLRFESAIKNAADNHDKENPGDAHEKAQTLYERIRTGYNHHEHLHEEFRPEEGNHRLFSKPCGRDVWLLQQVVPDTEHPRIVTVACATKPGKTLSDEVIVDTLKKAIVAELWRFQQEGQKGQIDIRLNTTDRRGDHVSEEMRKKIKELAKKENFTLKELGITQEMMEDNCGVGEKISLSNLYLDGDLVNSNDKAEDQPYAPPEAPDKPGIRMGMT